MAGEIDIDTVAKAYARWAPVYDFVFGAVFDAGRKATIAAAERIGGRLLHGRVGARQSLPHHPPPTPDVGGRYFRAMLRQGARGAPPPRVPPVAPPRAG